MPVSRLQHIPGIGVDHVGDRADAAHDPELLRMENLDTDLRPPAVAVERTKTAVDEDAASPSDRPPRPTLAVALGATTTRAASA